MIEMTGIDEDSMDRQFVRTLRARGVDVTTVGEIGTTSFTDEDQLILATEQQRVLYMANLYSVFSGFWLTGIQPLVLSLDFKNLAFH